MSIRKRIYATLAAHGFGQGVTVGMQLLLTPLFFLAWGAATYGEWLLLSSIPAYLMMADLGIGSAAGNEMSMRAGAGDRSGAQQTFLGAFRVVGFVSLGVMLFSLIASAAVWHWSLLPTPHISADTAAVIMLLLGLGVCVSFYSGVVSAGFRCCGQNALGIFSGNLGRLAEALLTGFFLLREFSPFGICVLVLVVKMMTTAAQVLVLRRQCAWLYAPEAEADRTLVRRLIAPSLGFLAIPLGSALALQGPIMVIGFVFGGAAVATFSALRTLSRIPLQMMNVLNSSVSPEMTFAYGAGNMALLRKLHRRAWKITAGMTLGSWLFLGVFGSWIVGMWLQKTVVHDPVMFHGLLLVAVISALWGVSSVMLTATNAHVHLGLVFVVAHAIGVGLMLVFGGQLGLHSLLVPMLLVEIFLLFFVFPQVLRISQDSPGEFLRSVIRAR